MFIDKEEDNELDLENELVVTDGVPETPEEEEQIETDTSNEVEEVQESTQEVEIPNDEEEFNKRVQEEANRIAKEIAEEKIEARLIRDRIKRERDEAPKKAKYEQLENILKTALGAENLDDIIIKSREYYKGEGIVIPEIVSKPHSEREETILAKAEAGDIIKLGKEEMESEASRISAIPTDKRSIRDKIIFNEVCSKLMNMKDEESLKSKGYDIEILNDKDFSSFRSQFNLGTPVSKVYEMYQTVKGTKPVQPKSPGSAKSNNSNNEIKEYYTPEEVRRFTEEDLENPKLMAVIEKSMQLWGKNK